MLDLVGNLKDGFSHIRNKNGFIEDVKNALFRAPACAPFVVVLNKSQLPSASYWLNPGSSGRTTDLDRL